MDISGCMLAIVPSDAPKSPMTPIYLRMPVDLVEDLDRWVEELQQERPGFRSLTRTDLIRDLLHDAVERRRASQAAPVPRPVRIRGKDKDE